MHVDRGCLRLHHMGCVDHARSHSLFFRCFESGSTYPQAQWLRGLRNNISRLHFERITKAGEEHDHSAVPVYLLHVKALQRSYSIVGTIEAATRKFAILTLQVRAPTTHFRSLCSLV